MFERRHYNKLAEFWNDERQRTMALGMLSRQTAESYEHFKLMLKRDNPNFKEHLFDKASGYTQ